MKLAIVCDDLIQRGGQERLVLSLCKIWPEAVLYTPIISDYWMEECSKRSITVRTSFLQVLPYKDTLQKVLGTFFLFNIAIESFNFENFDIVLSVSSRFAHGLNLKPSILHISYVNSPGRMFWESSSYFSSKILMYFLTPFLSFHRASDYISFQKVDYLIANAQLPSRRLQKYVHRDSDVIYPFVSDVGLMDFSAEGEPYFVVVSRLNDWKRVDLAIQACNETNLNLKIIGEGPALESLKSISGPRIEFLGYTEEAQKFKILAGASALIQTQKEDFGITALESMICGRPVIAYGRGGALETVVDGKTGIFFSEQTVTSVIESIKRFQTLYFDPKDCRRRATEFSESVFQDKMKAFVNDVYLKDQQL